MSNAVRVIYIIGAGRSGSTLLDTVLANHPDVVGVGELVNLHSAGWTSNEVCACGQLGTECGFWTRVRDAWLRRVPEATVAGYVALQKRIEFYSRLGLMQIARMLRQRISPTTEFQEYLRQTEALYQAIAEVSGKSVVVDSSKHPLRGALLAHLPSLDLRLVHLVRDARAVTWSRKKALDANKQSGVQTAIKPRPAWYSVAYWAFVNVLSLIVCLFRRRQSLRMRYEDFVADPQAQLDRVGRVCGLDYSTTAQALLTGESLKVEHPIAGNRMRMKGSVTLKPDWEWRERLPARDRAVCWLCAGWLLLAFGYGRSNARSQMTRLKNPSWFASVWEMFSRSTAKSAR
ncbi:MAG: sulfotransferase family protein [Planctomycetaceae bacterium]